jgi:hypothetical protein
MRLFVSGCLANAEELAQKLSGETWCCCQAFRIAGHPRYVWLNDSTSEDGAQEYAACRVGLAKGDVHQLESITFGWCDYETSLRYLRETIDGKDDNNEWARSVNPILQSPEEHGRCGFCA